MALLAEYPGSGQGQDPAGNHNRSPAHADGADTAALAVGFDFDNARAAHFEALLHHPAQMGGRAVVARAEIACQGSSRRAAEQAAAETAYRKLDS